MVMLCFSLRAELRNESCMFCAAGLFASMPISSLVVLVLTNRCSRPRRKQAPSVVRCGIGAQGPPDVTSSVSGTISLHVPLFNRMRLKNAQTWPCPGFDPWRHTILAFLPALWYLLGRQPTA